MGNKWFDRPKNLSCYKTISKEEIRELYLKRLQPVSNPRQVIEEIIKSRLPLMNSVSKMTFTNSTNNWVLKHFEELQNK